MDYIAANGQKLTEDMIESWCSSYEQGEFPNGEYTVGPVVAGRPPLSSEKTVTLTVKLPAGMKKALLQKAEQCDMTASAYARSVLADALIG